MTANKPDLFAIADSVFNRYGKHGYEDLNVAEKVFLCVWGLEGEVNNGGFDQYYFNSSGDHALDTVRALEAIGAQYTSKLVKASNALFGPTGPSPNREIRQKQLDALPDDSKKNMAEIEEEFFKYRDDLEKLLTEYVSKHPEVLGGRTVSAE